MDRLRKILSGKRKVAATAAAAAIICAVGLFVFFQKKAEPVGNEEKIYSVRTEKIGATGNDVYLSYAGLIQPEKTEQAAIAVIGNITDIYVDRGDSVVKGQALFSVDASSYERERDAAYQNMKASEAARDSAKSSMDRAKSSYDEVLRRPTQEEVDEADRELEEAREEERVRQSALNGIEEATKEKQQSVESAKAALVAKQDELDKYREEHEDDSEGRLGTLQSELARAQKTLKDREDELREEENNLGKADSEERYGAAVARRERAERRYNNVHRSRVASQEEIDALKSRYDSATHSYESADYAYQSRKASYERAVERVEDCTYKAGMDGTVIMKLAEEGGIATPINPVVVIGSHSLVAQFGVSQVDIKDISEGMAATVTVEGQTWPGKITSVELVPDETSRTYTTNVTLEAPSDRLYLGELATVRIDIGRRNGIWLPLSVIMNDGQDYVFTVREGRVARKNIKITDVSDDYVLVTGLVEGDEIITEGMKTVKSGNLVNVISGEQ